MRANKLIKQYFKKCWGCNKKFKRCYKNKYDITYLCDCDSVFVNTIDTAPYGIRIKWFYIELDNLLLMFSDYEVKIYYMFNKTYNMIDKQNFNSRLKGLKYFYNFYKKFKQNEVFL